MATSPLNPISAVILLLLSIPPAWSAPCEPVSWQGATARVSSSDWRKFELLIEDRVQKTRASQRVPVSGPGARCLKLAVHAESGYLILEFSAGVSGTQSASESEILLIYALQGTRFKEAARVELREHEGSRRTKDLITTNYVEAYRIVKGKSGWELETRGPGSKEPERVPLD